MSRDAGARVPISPEERRPILDARRLEKMSRSAHAYVRGSTEHFYRWLETEHGKSLPHGPAIWIGGDCHVGNLGPVAGPDGKVDIQLRDLDQTVIGSPSHDVIRLALSMAMAVRASGLPGTVTARVVENVARGYERALEARAARREAVLDRPPEALLQVVRAAGRRSRKELFEERLGGDERSIPIGERYWPLADAERDAVRTFIRSEAARRLVTVLSGREDHAKVDLVDAAFWVKGCSSLGLWRCAAIVRVRGKRAKSAAAPDDRLALIDVKEAPVPLAPRAPHARIPRHPGERVVTGTRKLAPNLGARTISATVAGKPVFVRELLPQDLKFDFDALSEEAALTIARYLASVVGMAHAAQLDSEACAEWLGEFRKTPAACLTAPDWLWASVVDLIALHEGAYLEHCRMHAMGLPRPAHGEGGIVSHHVTGE